eukprot:scaffold2205_cov167-Amphora_coffeaeformis.AAC.9
MKTKGTVAVLYIRNEVELRHNLPVSAGQSSNSIAPDEQIIADRVCYLGVAVATLQYIRLCMSTPLWECYCTILSSYPACLLPDNCLIVIRYTNLPTPTRLVTTIP